ncbi:YceI family protein [Ruania suaedae]|uniref:YceI family protein n=1 Tax=Ruania suaedae TaxID=2897774 RepID=UPI001E2C9B1E|nr:YceI family protein [Ruania suaedae]UFU03311.1 YceI family protein [Ruania suaedae]
MKTRTKVLIGTATGVLVLGGTGALVGPGLYADWVNAGADEEPSLAAPSSPTTSGNETSDTGNTAEAESESTLSGRWTVADGSYAGYRVDEVLSGEDITVTGRTESVTGEITIDGDDLTEAGLEVDMASIATDESQRDAYFRGTALETDTYPTATFELTSPVTLTDTTEVDLEGEMTIHGVTQEVTVDAEIATSEDELQVVGIVPISFSDYDVVAPDLGFVTVEDEGQVEFSLVLEPS